MPINKELQELRLQRGLTLEQVGNYVGVGKSTVKKWESGMIENMRRDKIAKLAFVLGVSADFLVQQGLRGTNDNQKEHIMKRITTDEAVEREIATLLEDKDVQLAKAEQRAKYKRRQYLYTLRYLQKRGKELREAGITKEAFTNLSQSTEKDLEDVEE